MAVNQQTLLKIQSLELQERLRMFEEQYLISSAEFYRQFRAGEMGDEADYFEWSAFYQMWLSTREQLDLLKIPAA
jgi:hypothetical protein